MDIRVERTAQPKQKPQDESKLPWGYIFTDHMFMMDYDDNKGWHNARIVPYGPITLEPSAKCFHYGQELFEGMKAYKIGSGKIVMFRPDMNMRRLNESCDRMCMPRVNADEVLAAIQALVKIDEAWVPTSAGTALYIRPVMFATEAGLSAHPSASYTFIVMLSPVGAYYKNGLAPVRIYVENEYVRAVRGGTGFAKCGGNYAASMKSQHESEKLGYSQVLWLDGIERKYIEEVGAMNVCFVIDGKVITPALNGSILPGVTRNTVIRVLRDWKIPVEENRISIGEVAEAYKAGKLQEVFGCGTAAVISPVGELKWGDTIMNINGGKIGELSQRLYDEITGIQTGKIADMHAWVHEL